MTTPELIYFNGRGYAEIIRIVLTACDVKFLETPLQSKEQLANLKPDLPFGQVPVLKIGNKSLVQSGAIVRHFARIHNLYGKDEDEKTKVDIYYEGSRDFCTPFRGIGFTCPFDKIVENTQSTVSKYLPFFNKVLVSNGSNGHLVGSSLTLADLGLLEALLATKDYYETTVFDEYPGIKKFMKTMSEKSFCQKYIKDIRMPVNSPEKLAIARQILGL